MRRQISSPRSVVRRDTNPYAGYELKIEPHIGVKLQIKELRRTVRCEGWEYDLVLEPFGDIYRIGLTFYDMELNQGYRLETTFARAMRIFEHATDMCNERTYRDVLSSLGEIAQMEAMRMVVQKRSKTLAGLRRKLYDPNYLPTWKDVLDAFPADIAAYRYAEWKSFCKMRKHEIYELINREHLEELARYLVTRAQHYGALVDHDVIRQLTVVEVGAGNGKLTHHLQQILNEMVPGLFRVIATDSGEWEIAHAFPVELQDAATAMSAYNPDIVIQSWMCHRQDTTWAFRQEASVQEYVLIGPGSGGSCGHDVRTWGTSIDLSAREKKTHNDLMISGPHGKRLMTAYEADGFDQIRLDEVSAFNIGRADEHPGRCPGSSTIAFRRVSDPYPQTVRDKLERFYRKILGEE